MRRLQNGAAAIGTGTRFKSRPERLPTNDWKLTLVKVSKTDPNWEVINGTEISTNQSKDFLLIWNNMAGAWEVLSDAGPPWTGVEFKGEAVPSDLTTI